MAGGNDVSVKAAAASAQQKKGVARRLWRVVRALLFVLRRGVLLPPSGRKLAVDVTVLLRRGKIAGKALRSLVSFTRQRHAAFSSCPSYTAAGGGRLSFSCLELDPALAVHEPSRGLGLREVEFSCSNTPSSKRRGGGRNHRDDEAAASGYYYSYDAADIARVFELLNDGGHLFDEGALLASATPSPGPRAPPSARQLRITDSPFPARDEAEQQLVDTKADEFIRRFYEQLRAQRSAAATPEYCYGQASTSYNGRSPRPVAAAAGIA